MSDKFFELRIYTVYPDQLNNLMSLWNKNYKYITKYFKCIGVWNSKNGDINKVYHMYEWDTYKQMDNQKNNFKKDSKMKLYIKNVKKMYLKQESIILEETEFSRKYKK